MEGWVWWANVESFFWIPGTFGGVERFARWLDPAAIGAAGGGGVDGVEGFVGLRLGEELFGLCRC